LNLKATKDTDEKAKKNVDKYELVEK